MADKKLEKKEAINICKKNGIDISSFSGVIFATRSNKDNKYWANPNIKYTEKEWLFILNDDIKKELHCFKIPANSLPKYKIKIREICSQKIDLKIQYADENFKDTHSQIDFKEWKFKEIKY